MELKRIFGIIPIPVFYVEKVRDGFAGVSYGFFIKIAEKYKDDIGLLNHELHHCKQFYATGGVVHAFLYAFVSRYKYWAELTAYRVQLKSAVDDADRERLVKKFAYFIANKYNLNVSEVSTANDLRE